MSEVIFWHLFEKLYTDRFFFIKFTEKYDWMLKNTDYSVGACINDDGSINNV